MEITAAMTELTAQIIQRYAKYSTAELREKAGRKFRAWVRKRDAGDCCISCGTPHPSDAGHFYPAGTVKGLELNPDNCHRQCRSCNYYKSADLHNYRVNLIRKIGIERVEQLDRLAAMFKQTGFKGDRFYYIEQIEKFK